jgi:hypothetical protein
MSPPLREAIEKAIELAASGDEWINFSVSTGFDEGFHLIIECGAITRCRVRIGGASRDFAHPRLALEAA